ncbi:hypothetical protein LDG_7281 [Legionella drancourtii LLAP12]|uniref:Uncharacterized protein n=1 Tax=Legionella drancourtii LLAP12 TaxID=658187 RepID=G9EPU0_9GAMM|nr:hypothetical protein LDG_7281 [Legionella drancourtii LLAP12]
MGTYCYCIYRGIQKYWYGVWCGAVGLITKIGIKVGTVDIKSGEFIPKS